MDFHGYLVDFVKYSRVLKYAVLSTLTVQLQPGASVDLEFLEYAIECAALNGFLRSAHHIDTTNVYCGG